MYRFLMLATVVAAQGLGCLALLLMTRGARPSLHELGIAAGAALASSAVAVAVFARAHRAADRRARKHRLLGELAAEVNRDILLNEDESKIFSTILDYSFRILEYVNMGSVLAFDEGGELVIVASRGFDEAFVRGFRIRLEDTFQYKQSGGSLSDAMIIQPETIQSSWYLRAPRTPDYKSILSAPLYVDGKLYGLLSVDSYRANTFGPEDLDLFRHFRAQIEVCLLARERYRASLAESRSDGLTGFLSRSYFDELFAHSVEHANRFGERFTLGMFDIDGLKRINDAFGHQAGDELIKKVAGAIRLTARKSDVIGRYGGDEFIAICYNADAATMGERAERTLAELGAGPVALGGRPVAVSFCYGFADYPGEASDFEGLVALADARLYTMKTERGKRSAGDGA